MKSRRLELIAAAAAAPQVQTVLERIETSSILGCSIILRNDQLYNPQPLITIGLCGLNGPTQEPLIIIYHGCATTKHPVGALCTIDAQPDMFCFLTATYYAAQHITAYLLCG